MKEVHFIAKILALIFGASLLLSCDQQKVELGDECLSNIDLSVFRGLHPTIAIDDVYYLLGKPDEEISVEDGLDLAYYNQHGRLLLHWSGNRQYPVGMIEFRPKFDLSLRNLLNTNIEFKKYIIKLQCQDSDMITIYLKNDYETIKEIHWWNYNKDDVGILKQRMDAIINKYTQDTTTLSLRLEYHDKSRRIMEDLIIMEEYDYEGLNKDSIIAMLKDQKELGIKSLKWELNNTYIIQPLKDTLTAKLSRLERSETIPQMLNAIRQYDIYKLTFYLIRKVRITSEFEIERNHIDSLILNR